MRMLLLAMIVGACGRSQSVSDQDLGGLVVASKPASDKIDVDLASKDPDELTRALMRPYHLAAASLGPHAITIASQTQTDQAGARVEDLSDNAVLETGADGAWHGTYTNSADYGRESVYVGKQLYLRPRYQRWHGRAPESPEEPAQLYDAYAEAIGATWELLAPGVELTDGGVVQVAGRSGRKIIVKLAPQGRPMPPEKVTQRAWRVKRTVDKVQGEIVLDADTGVPLHVALTGAVSFPREGKQLTINMGVTSDLTMGAPAIAAPAPADVVATPERQREVDDRDFLLHDIAPPLRKNPDGTAVAPAPVKKKP